MRLQIGPTGLRRRYAALRRLPPSSRSGRSQRLPDRDPFDSVLVDLATAQAIVDGRMGDPFAVLGPHHVAATGTVIRAFLPGALDARVLERGSGRELCRLQECAAAGFFVGRPTSNVPYLLKIAWPAATQETEDPYSFGP